jgi:hypothetical protein
MKAKTLSPELLHRMDAYWRTANYLSVGQQRPKRCARHGHGLLWGCAHPGNARRRLPHAPASARPENPGGQRRRPHEAAAADRAPARLAIWISTGFSPGTSRSSSPTMPTRGLIHRLTYRRTNHDNIHVRGYKEEGTITTPFDMTVLNDLDRFHLVMDAVDRLPQTGDKGIYLKHLGHKFYKGEKENENSRIKKGFSCVHHGCLFRDGVTFLRGTNVDE